MCMMLFRPTAFQGRPIKVRSRQKEKIAQYVGLINNCCKYRRVAKRQWDNIGGKSQRDLAEIFDEESKYQTVFHTAETVFDHTHENQSTTAKNDKQWQELMLNKSRIFLVIETMSNGSQCWVLMKRKIRCSLNAHRMEVTVIKIRSRQEKNAN